GGAALDVAHPDQAHPEVIEDRLGDVRLVLEGEHDRTRDLAIDRLAAGEPALLQTVDFGQVAVNQGVFDPLVGTAEVRADAVLDAHGARVREQAGEPGERATARNLAGPLIDRVVVRRPVDPGDRPAALVRAAGYDVLRLEPGAVGNGPGCVLGAAPAVQVASGSGDSFAIVPRPLRAI